MDPYQHLSAISPYQQVYIFRFKVLLKGGKIWPNDHPKGPKKCSMNFFGGYRTPLKFNIDTKNWMVFKMILLSNMAIWVSKREKFSGRWFHEDIPSNLARDESLPRWLPPPKKKTTLQPSPACAVPPKNAIPKKCLGHKLPRSPFIQAHSNEGTDIRIQIQGTFRNVTSQQK